MAILRDLNHSFRCLQSSLFPLVRKRKIISSASLAFSATMTAMYSTSATASSSLPCSNLADTATSVLDKISFGIPVKGSQIEILHQPSDFYNHLIHMVERAEKRVHIATLYLGTSEMEQRLVDTLKKRMTEQPQLEVHFHLDYLRGNRIVDGVSSVSMLRPIFENSASTVSMYHTPELTGWKRYLVPNRYNEALGVSHFKCFVVDDDVVLTGANLSHSYFTDRQDRYIRFRQCRQLADFYSDLVSCIGNQLSYKYHSTDEIEEPNPSPVYQPHQFKEHANQVLSKFLLNYTESQSDRHRSLDEWDTLIYPLVQMRSFGIQQDETAVATLLETIRDRSVSSGDKYRLIMSTGYFNLTQELEDRLLDFGKNPVRLLCASQEANGFYGGRGLAGFVPHAYSHILESFMDKVTQCGLKYQILPWLYDRPGWTYHAKGFWLYDNDSVVPSVMSIGSPNYGHRSTFKDLESECILVTKDSELQKRMQIELEQLFKFSTSLGTDRLDIEARNALADYERRRGEIAKWVPIVLPYIRTML